MDPAMTTLLAEQLGERATQDPFAALLLQQLRSNEEGVDDELDELRRDVARARQTIERLKTEVGAANAMARYVAQMLGACSSCWGLNPVCPRCLGNGRPGSEQPAIRELLDWITPALHRAGLITTHRAGASPGSELLEGATYAGS